MYVTRINRCYVEYILRGRRQDALKYDLAKRMSIRLTLTERETFWSLGCGWSGLNI